MHDSHCQQNSMHDINQLLSALPELLIARQLERQPQETASTWLNSHRNQIQLFELHFHLEKKKTRKEHYQ